MIEYKIEIMPGAEFLGAATSIGCQPYPCRQPQVAHPQEFTNGFRGRFAVLEVVGEEGAVVVTFDEAETFLCERGTGFSNRVDKRVDELMQEHVIILAHGFVIFPPDRFQGNPMGRPRPIQIIPQPYDHRLRGLLHLL